MESLGSAIARMNRKSWAVAMASGGFAFVLMMLLDHLPGLARSIAVAVIIPLWFVFVGAGIHFGINLIRTVFTHGHRRDDG